jgi:hypothetical protein
MICKKYRVPFEDTFTVISTANKFAAPSKRLSFGGIGRPSEAVPLRTDGGAVPP